MNLLDRVRLEKAAADCGFELTPNVDTQGALVLRSAMFPENVRVFVAESNKFCIEASNPALLERAVDEAVVAVSIDDFYLVLRKASAIGRTLPNRVADKFRTQIAALPSTTEAERLVIQRVGQDIFREALLDYWQGQCCVTGLGVRELLRASHIKPWSRCSGDNERLDVFNGLLLAPHVDALFDGGWISFADDGKIIVSPVLPYEACKHIGISNIWHVAGLTDAHREYLQYHRKNELRVQCS